MGSHEALKYYPPAAATTKHGSTSVDGVDTSLISTVTPSTGTARRSLRYYHSEPRLVPQSALLSPRLSPRCQRQQQQQQQHQQQQQQEPQQQQQQQQQLEADTSVGVDTIPSRRGSPQRPLTGGTSSLSKPHDDTEQQRRQLLQQVLHPARPTAQRAATAGHGDGDRAPSVGGEVQAGVVPSPSSPPSASPSSPVQVPPELNSSLLVQGEAVELVSSPPRVAPSSPLWGTTPPRGATPREKKNTSLTSAVDAEANYPGRKLSQPLPQQSKPLQETGGPGRKPSLPLPQQSRLLRETGGDDAIASPLSAGQIVAHIFRQACGENGMELEKTGGDGGVRGEPESMLYNEAGNPSSSTVSVAQLHQQRGGRRPLAERTTSVTVHQEQLQWPSPRRRISPAWFASSQDGEDSSSSAEFVFNEKRPSRKRSLMKELLPNEDSRRRGAQVMTEERTP